MLFATFGPKRTEQYLRCRLDPLHHPQGQIHWSLLRFSFQESYLTEGFSLFSNTWTHDSQQVPVDNHGEPETCMFPLQSNFGYHPPMPVGLSLRLCVHSRRKWRVLQFSSTSSVSTSRGLFRETQENERHIRRNSAAEVRGAASKSGRAAPGMVVRVPGHPSRT